MSITPEQVFELENKWIQYYPYIERQILDLSSIKRRIYGFCLLKVVDYWMKRTARRSRKNIIISKNTFIDLEKNINSLTSGKLLGNTYWHPIPEGVDKDGNLK